ncbi:MAG TPA: RagB/SusD family nutrient uptake outer membrane protein [Cyclobacteriaceae bacterium]
MKTFKILSILILTLGLNSCSDSFLDLPDDGVQSVENAKIFESEDGCVSYVTGVYGALNWNDWWQVQFVRQFFDTSTDDGWLGNLSQWGNAASYLPLAHWQNLDANNANLEGYWTYNYFGVQRCNYGIENISKADIDQTLKDRLIAEMKFLRGWFYFELVKNWGDVPLYTTPRTANDAAIPRTPKAEVYAQIIRDFDEASQVLPKRSEYSGNDISRASKGAALAFKAKAELWSENFAAAEATAKMVIDQNEYGLESDFGHIYVPKKYNGIESIFEISSNDQAGNTRPTTTGSQAEGGWGWNVPSSNLEQAFLAENDTVRLVRTINKHGEKVYGDPIAFSTGIFNSQLAANKSGRNWRKHYEPRALRQQPGQSYTTRWSTIPYIFMRYGEVLLIYAEASAHQGKDAQAQGALNQIRSRVNLPAKNVTGAALIDAIIAERRLEFAGELTYRWDDLHRVKRGDKLLIDEVLGPDGSFVTYNATSTDPFETLPGHDLEPQNKGYYFKEGINELLPIPSKEINSSNGAIVQNKGY